MLKPSDRYASDECQWALNNVSADEFTGQGRTANYEICSSTLLPKISVTRSLARALCLSLPLAAA